MFLSVRTRFILPLLIGLTLVGCGGKKNKNTAPAVSSSSSSSSSSSTSSSSSSSSSSGQSGPDTQGPNLNVIFPGVIGFTEGTSVTVRGKASDQTAIKSVTVNGVDATTTNNWADWQLKLEALKDGTNTLVVSAEDTLGQTSTQTLKLIKRDHMSAPQLTALDTAGNRLFIYDSSIKGIFVVDLSTGVRTVLSRNKTDDKILFQAPTSMVFDTAGNQLIVSDLEFVALSGTAVTSIGHLIAINTQTGERSEFTAGTLVDIKTSSVSLRNPQSMALDPATRTLYVLDNAAIYTGSTEQGSLLYEVAILKFPLDKEKPNPVLVSDNLTTEAEPFSNTSGIYFDSQLNRLIANTQIGETTNSLGVTVERWFGFIAIDITTGVRTAISGKSVDTEASYPFRIYYPGRFFVDNGFIYYYDRTPTPERFLKINTTTGERSEWFNNNAPDHKYDLRVIASLDYDPVSGSLFVLDDALDAVFKIETKNAFKRSPVASNGEVSESTQLNFSSATSLNWDQAQQRLLVTNPREGTINAFDLVNGNVSLFCNFGVQDPNLEKHTPIKSVLDTVGNRIVAIGGYLRVDGDFYTQSYRINSCDLKDGSTKNLANEDSATENLIRSPSGLALDLQKNIGYVFHTVVEVSDGYQTQRNSILEIDLSTGTRKEFAAFQTFDNPRGDITFDQASGKLIFTSLRNATLYTIDTSTKSIATLTNNVIDNTSVLKIPRLLFWDKSDLFTFDSTDKSVIRIMPDGKRKVLYSLNSAGPNPINQVSDLVLDSQNQRAFLIDQSIGMLAIQDLVSGESVYLAK